ncbi:vacuolar protein sorting-associated protein VTA1 homolog [Lepeophtheirus salmonis]|nr:vacuolar protein sorting-associated protein VTA1 homolog [Lepeophtheirus salmonis]
MGSLKIPPIPSSLKAIAHFLNVASEHENRDPVVTYWARVHALEIGMKLDKKSKEALGVLLPLMDWLESEKKVLNNREEVTSNVVANAHMENYALKLFSWADKEDRASRFNKNVIKAFYTAGNILEILSTFGEQTQDILRIKKYAKWRAAYIHKCLKEGITPTPGSEEHETSDQEEDEGKDNNLTPVIGASSSYHQPQDSNVVEEEEVNLPASSRREEEMDPHVVIQAQKYCKYATNALDFANKQSAIENLEKALQLLQIGALSH